MAIVIPTSRKETVKAIRDFNKKLDNAKTPKTITKTKDLGKGFWSFIKNSTKDVANNALKEMGKKVVDIDA